MEKQIKSGVTLTVTLSCHTTTSELLDNNRNTLNFIDSHHIEIVILDFSAVNVIELTFMKLYFDLFRTIQVSGRRAYFVGIRPAHALILVESGIDFSGIKFYRDADEIFGRSYAS